MAKKDETGDCSKCCHTAEIAQCTTEDERVRLRKICLSCIRGCKKCKFNKRKERLEAFIAESDKGNTKDSLLDEKSSLQNYTCRFCKCHTKGKSCNADCKTLARIAQINLALPIFSETIPNTTPPTPIKASYAHALVSRIEAEECYNCTKCPSTDNMPSHGGKEFVYIEAAEEPQTVLDRADPFYKPQPLSDPRDFDEPQLSDQAQLERQKVTEQLPAAIEERLLQEMKTFIGSMDWVDRCLVLFLMQGGKLVDFGKMDWIPKEFINGISNKANLTMRYKKIVKTMPILKSVAHGMIGKGIGGAKRKNASSSDSSAGESVTQYDLFGNRI